MTQLLYGLITGILFGALLQQAQVARFERQVGAMRLIDFTIVKFMLTSIVVAAAGIYLLRDLGLVSLSVKGLSIGAQAVGGLLFGIGWAVLGYCPGTVGAAVGEGRLHALWGVVGMLIGGGLYGVLYPFFDRYVVPVGNFGSVTLPDLLGVSHWLIIALMAVGSFFLFRWLERRERALIPAETYEPGRTEKATRSV